MIFQHTWKKVLSGEKTQTRRIVKPGQVYRAIAIDGKQLPPSVVTSPNYRPKSVYFVGKTYAVQPGRGKYGVYYRCLPDGKLQIWNTHHQGVPTFLGLDDEWKTYIPARIRILSIRCENVRNISEADAKAEGFDTREDFWSVWVDMHDPSWIGTYTYAADCDYLKEYGFYNRPAERYQAWVLTFELCKAVQS